MGITIGAAIILSTTESPVPVPTTTGDVVGDSVTGSIYPLHCVSYCGFCKHCWSKYASEYPAQRISYNVFRSHCCKRYASAYPGHELSYVESSPHW